MFNGDSAYLRLGCALAVRGDIRGATHTPSTCAPRAHRLYTFTVAKGFGLVAILAMALQLPDREQLQLLREIQGEMLDQLSRSSSMKDGLLDMVTSWEFSEWLHVAVRMSQSSGLPEEHESSDTSMFLLKSVPKAHREMLAPVLGPVDRIDEVFGSLVYNSPPGQIDVAEIEARINRACYGSTTPRMLRTRAREAMVFFGGMLFLREMIKPERFSPEQVEDFFEVWSPLAEEAATSCEAMVVLIRHAAVAQGEAEAARTPPGRRFVATTWGEAS